MLKVIFYVVVIVLVLSFFGISLQHLIEAPTTQSNFSYVWSLVLDGWNQLVGLFTGLWNSIWNLVF
jgi:hypothetical protein